MAEEWRSVLVLSFNNDRELQTCDNFAGIKLSHTMKLRERLLKSRLRAEVKIWKQQYGFMPRGAVFALRL